MMFAIGFIVGVFVTVTGLALFFVVSMNRDGW